MKKITVVVLAVVAVVVVVFFWKPFSPKGTSEAQATRISTAVISRGDLVISVSSTGVVEPILKIDLKSKASGEIIELPFEEGDRVVKGQLIARLNASTTQNEFEQAQADLEVAEAALEQATKQADRQKQMFEQGLISELDYDNSALAKEQATSALVRARASLETAKERLSDTVIKSPIDGIVLQKYVEKGQIIASGISAVSGGTIIATIADLSRAYVKTSVDEVDIGQIVPGQKANIIAESYPDHEFEGEVLRIHPLAKTNQNVTIFQVTTLVDNPDGLLMAGMNANVEITAGFKEGALLVPREALTDARSIARLVRGGQGGQGGQGSPGGQQAGGMVQRREGGGERAMPASSENDTEKAKNSGGPKKMVIIVANGKQEPRPVEIGLSNFEQAEVLSGLSEGDTVLTTVTSKALQDREEMMERMRSWNQVPGMERRR